MRATNTTLSLSLDCTSVIQVLSAYSNVSLEFSFTNFNVSLVLSFGSKSWACNTGSPQKQKAHLRFEASFEAVVVLRWYLQQQKTHKLRLSKSHLKHKSLTVLICAIQHKISQSDTTEERYTTRRNSSQKYIKNNIHYKTASAFRLRCRTTRHSFSATTHNFPTLSLPTVVIASYWILYKQSHSVNVPHTQNGHCLIESRCPSLFFHGFCHF